MSKQYNLNKSKEAKGYYIDITRPYEQVVQDIIKLNPNAINEKYIINGTGNHSLQEWVKNHKNEGHTLIDATPPVKQQPLNNQDNNTSVEEVSKEDFSGNRDISSSVYNEHFDRGNTFVDPSSNKYMDIKQRLRWDNAEAKNRAFNRQADLVFGGALYGGAGMYAAGAAAPWIATTFAPGTVGGNILGDTAGMIAIDETSKALTGRTTGQHIGDALGLAEDSNWRYAVDFANPINIMGPGLLRKGISSGINYVENVANPYKIFNTLKSPIKISGFREHPVSAPKFQYGINNIESSSLGTPRHNEDLNNIYVSPEILAKRSDNAEHAIDIYRKRLNNGGIKLVYDRGTANYKVSDIKVAQSDKDILASIKALEADNPIPPAADYYNLKKDLLDLRESYVIQDNPRSLNEIKKELQNREGWEDLTPADFDDFVQYIVAKPSPKLKNWLMAQNETLYSRYSRGYAKDNFAWAPNKETLEQILNNYFSNLDKEKVANNLKYWQNTLPHEFEHTFQNASKLYKKYYSPKHLIPKMDESAKLSPEQFNLIADEMSQLIGFRPESRYFLNPTELLARGTQIKNWLGITDPKYQLTAKDIKEAAKYYSKTGLNNSMTEFFNSITDWDKAAKFLSYATAAAGVGSTVGLNNTKLVKKPHK